MEEMGFLGPFLVQLGAPMKWAGLEVPKCVAVHQRVNVIKGMGICTTLSPSPPPSLPLSLRLRLAVLVLF